MKETKDVCGSCKGSGRQVFHGAFQSVVGVCNFCAGHGTKEEQLKWYDETYTGRGLGAVTEARLTKQR
jgi:DnaJ-class molecular chaperone